MSLVVQSMLACGMKWVFSIFYSRVTGIGLLYGSDRDQQPHSSGGCGVGKAGKVAKKSSHVQFVIIIES